MSPVASVPLWARDAASNIQQAPQTFSNWDKCMAKDYCKWPVIVGIIIGSIIILSAVACVINCLCCGITCCKGCCECCSCCCPTPRHHSNRPKYMDDPYRHQPPPPQPLDNSYRSPPAPPVYGGPQFARFDNPSSSGAKPGNEDALPEMPSWNNAATRRVEDTTPQRDDMEMEPLNPAQNHQASPSPVNPMPGTSYANYRGLDDPSSYTPRSPTMRTASPAAAPFSPYEVGQPYQNHSYNNQYPSRTVAPGAQATLPMAVSSPSEMPGYSAFQRQQSPFQRQPSPGSMQPPSYATNPQTPYRGMSPSMPTSPPPPFSSAPAPHEVSDPGRPPSLLQSGRKPVPYSYRDV